VKLIKEMTEQEIIAEIETYPELNHHTRACLEHALCLCAYIRGWTGDPLCQPANSVLAALRQIYSHGDGGEFHAGTAQGSIFPSDE
jgi:hypothetical protein